MSQNLHFNQKGYLYPIDIFTIEYDNFKETYVFNDRRKNLFTEFDTFLTEIKQFLLEPFFIWINGSYVTQKMNPNDIDCVIFLENSIFNFHESNLNLIKYKYKSLKIDSYFVKLGMEFTEYDKIEWRETFHKIRDSKEKKGFIQIDINNEKK
jgi:Nucleotidyltransferase domain